MAEEHDDGGASVRSSHATRSQRSHSRHRRCHTEMCLSGLAMLHVHRDHSRRRRCHTEMCWTYRASIGAALPKLNV